MQRVERERCAEMALTEATVAPYVGRDKPARWIWQNVLGDQVGYGERLDAAGRAAKTLTTKIGTLLRCLSKGPRLDWALASLRKFDGKALGAEWWLIKGRLKGPCSEDELKDMQAQLNKEVKAVQGRAARARGKSWREKVKAMMAKSSR